MAQIFNQALSHRFGVTLTEYLESGEWSSFEVAVAWVRRSGMRHLLPSLREFLDDGRIARFTIGVDIENTSFEGLQDLLTLSAIGDCKTVIYHNESSSVFHPKVFLFSNDRAARLIVGSNNLTEAGLFTNTEVSLQVDASLDSPVIKEIREALDSWRDQSEGLSLELDTELLDALANEGYVLTEEALRRRRGESERTRANAGPGRPRRSLFGRKTFTAPKPPVGAPILGPEAEPPSPRGGISIGETLRVRGHRHPLRVTNVLLMRVRPARGTQVQLPIPLRECNFFAGQNSIIAGGDRTVRTISPTHPERAGGAVNTYKVEMPETEGLEDPVVRLERTATGIEYYVYDADSIQGRPVMAALREGRNDDPPFTVLTKPSDPDHCTWYRFI